MRVLNELPIGPAAPAAQPIGRLQSATAASLALLRALLACLLLTHVATAKSQQQPAGILWGRQAAEALLRDQQGPVSGAAAGVAFVAASLKHPDRDFGYSLTTKKALFLCRGLAVSAIAGGSADPPPHAHSHLHAAAGSSRRLLQGGSVSAALGALPGAPDPTSLDRAFELHSRPGAPYFLLLDFTGHRTTGTRWNTDYHKSVIVTPPYDIDGDSGTFSAQERANIIAIWRAVAEDYAPFAVDVTTEETDASGRPINLVARGARAAIGGSSRDWANDLAGGLSYIGSFGDPYSQPAFVFPAQLANASSKAIWEATSHELGHTLGLFHDGFTDIDGTKNEYFWGQGDWAPIMGAAYNKSISQWSKGEYPEATNKQDDLWQIAYVLGWRHDDHGNTPAAATPLPAGTPLPGQIGRSGEADWFSFAAAPGVLSLTLSLVPRYGNESRANLNARMALWGPCGASPLAVWDPQGSLLSGTRRFNLTAAGTHFVSVSGVGDGRLATGYSSYGSLGDYSIQAAYRPGPAAAGPCPAPPRPAPPPPRLRVATPR
ncbi:hypothetical protein ABPG75_000558 [Micractinium tetrahymenae]